MLIRRMRSKYTTMLLTINSAPHLTNSERKKHFKYVHANLCFTWTLQMRGISHLDCNDVQEAMTNVGVRQHSQKQLDIILLFILFKERSIFLKLIGRSVPNQL